jgi:Mlc titration factor MtfA (ptsG expression regulator)
MNRFHRWLRRLVGLPAHLRIPAPLWEGALRRAAWTQGLDADARQRLRGLTERFLADKAISAAGDAVLADEDRVLIALLCCRPVLGLGYDWLDGWHEVIVYPGAFRVRNTDVHHGTGVHEERHVRATGLAWQRGPLVLAWDQVLRDLREPGRGSDVVVHEIAHKLDVLDGSMNGAPPLSPGELAAWARDFQAAFDALHDELEAGHVPGIDPYAAHSPQEFFAVCSEYWFSAPDVLHAEAPRVAALLRQFYGEPARAAA